MRGLHASLAFLLAAVMLSACGFHLRGALALSDEMAPVYVDAGSLQGLGREIQQFLQSNNIRLSSSPAGARTVLGLLGENRSSRVLAVDGQGKAREYLLRYSVRYSVWQAGQPPAEAQKDTEARAREYSLEVSRSLVFDENAVLAFANEADVVYDELRRDAARRILMKLQALSLQPAAQTAPAP